jgi:hypothetical protein
MQIFMLSPDDRSSRGDLLVEARGQFTRRLPERGLPVLQYRQSRVRVHEEGDTRDTPHLADHRYIVFHQPAVGPHRGGSRIREPLRAIGRGVPEERPELALLRPVEHERGENGERRLPLHRRHGELGFPKIEHRLHHEEVDAGLREESRLLAETPFGFFLAHVLLEYLPRGAHGARDENPARVVSPGDDAAPVRVFPAPGSEKTNRFADALDPLPVRFGHKRFLPLHGHL